MRLSIVVNMYNTAKYMPKCLDSVLNQDIPLSDYEIILVNDGSPDNSLEMAKEYASKYSNIRVLSHENKGLAGARNTGIDAAIGQYLCFVDPDDYIEKNSLSELLLKMDNENLEMLRFNYQKVDENYNFVKDSKGEAKFDYSDNVISGTEFLANRLGVACYVWAYIYRTDFVKSSNIRFFEGGYFDDTPWLPRLLQKVERINCIPIRHQYYLQRSGSLVHTKNVASILKKADGQIALIEELQEQKLHAPEETQDWYDMMIAHGVISVLTLLASNLYDKHQLYTIKISKLNVLPLQYRRIALKNLYKICVINVSPNLYCWLLNVKQILHR